MSGAFGTALVTTAWDQSTTHARVDLAGNLHQPHAVLNMLQAQGRSAGQALQMLGDIVQSQAVMLATNRVSFYLAIVIACVAAGVWLSPKPKGPVTLSAGGH
jgi:DHA2 family multidrug resistance protein